MHKTNSLADNQQGFASIVIALVLITVLALLTVGFAQLARREQQTALASQLAVQANDAAESGINDAYSDILNGLIVNNDDTDLTSSETAANADTCMTPQNALSGTRTIPSDSTAYKTSDQTIDASRDVSYTCLLVDLEPTTIEYSQLSAGKDQYTSFTTNTAPDSFTINWSSADGKTGYPSSLTLGAEFMQQDSTIPSATTWNSNGYAPVLQVSITPIGSPITRSNLTSNTYTAYLFPSTSNTNDTGTYQSGIGNNDATDTPVLSGNCGSGAVGGYPCSVKISGFSTSGAGAGPYLVRVLDYYDQANVLISAAPTSPVTTPVKFIDGQAQIDVTGQAHNVLKRLQVRLPLKASPELPPYAVEGQDICERLNTAPATAEGPSATTYGPSSSTDVTYGTSVGNSDPCSFGGILAQGSDD
jgi:Tfp pilus assembly protein PilX